MKNIKMVILTLLLALFTVHFPYANARIEKALLPFYQEVISEIQLGYSDGMLTGRIKLANGPILNIIDYKTRDDNLMNRWQAGDAVLFTPHVSKGKLILAVNRVFYDQVENDVEPYVIFDAISSPKTGLTITEIGEKGKSIKLSDNSDWEFSFYNSFSTEEWSVGDRLLVSGGGNKNSYTLINLDVPLKHNVFRVTGSLVVE